LSSYFDEKKKKEKKDEIRDEGSSKEGSKNSREVEGKLK